MGAAANAVLALGSTEDRPKELNATQPIDDVVFAELMEPLGPFERPPRLAVAISGGADSMALTLLANQWALARRGLVLALTVDHGLRDGSGAEADQVGRWLAGRGIEHRVIRWTGAKPRTGLQEAARAARYALLLDRCRDVGIVHLLVAHHRGDQAETVLLRAARGSGEDGLAAMAPAFAATGARLLRPLLDVPRSRLEATLVASGQGWINDPSNRNRSFARVRLREFMRDKTERSVDAATLAETPRKMARKRATRDAETAALLAQAARLYPAGYAGVDAIEMAGAPDDIGMRALGRLIRTIGGGIYPTPTHQLERLWWAVKAGLAARRSLGGCLVAPGRQWLLVAREPSAMEPPVPVSAGRVIRWDGRFLMRLGGSGSGRVGGLGQDGWRMIRKQVERPELPRAIVSTLPALFDADGPIEVPHLGWRRGTPRGFGPLPVVDSLAFAPGSALTGTFWSSWDLE